VLPPTGSRHFGTIKSYNPEHGYGFITCPEIWQGDVHFSRSLLPIEVQDLHWQSLAGIPVEFELMVNRDGKLRTERLWLLEPVRSRPPGYRPDFDKGKGGGKDYGKGGRHFREDHHRDRRDRHVDRDGPPPPDLDEVTVQEMTRFLEEKGGVMDHGKFANAFPGVKKSQLEPHFVLVPEDESHSGGRWSVMLPGIDPPTKEEREAREAEEAAAEEQEQEQKRPRKPVEEVEPLVVEPSSTLRLIGVVKKWDKKKGYGFVEADGVDDVFIHRNDLPPEVRNWRGDFEGVELTFVLDAAAEGKLKAVDVHLLLVPDNEGRWQLRRVTPLEETAAGEEEEDAEPVVEEEEEELVEEVEEAVA